MLLTGTKDRVDLGKLRWTYQRGEGATHELKEGGLAGSVGPHQGNAAVQVDAVLDVAVEDLAARVAEGDVEQLQHGGGQLAGVVEAEVEHLLLGHLGQKEGTQTKGVRTRGTRGGALGIDDFAVLLPPVW